MTNTTEVKFVKIVKNDITANTRIWQTLWQHENGGDHLLVSSSVRMSLRDPDDAVGMTADHMAFGIAEVNEMMAFPADEHGSWLSGDELAADKPAKWVLKDHENLANVAAIENLRRGREKIAETH